MRSTSDGATWDRILYTTEGKTLGGSPVFFSQNGKGYFVIHWGITRVVPLANGVAESSISLPHGIASLVELDGRLYGIGSSAANSWYDSPYAISLVGNYTSTSSPSVVTKTIDIAIRPVNDAPAVGADMAEVSVSEGETATNHGTFSDVDQSDQVTITASIGTITQDAGASGDWSWSYTTTDGPDQSQPVIVTAIDSDGAIGTAEFALMVDNVPPTVTLTGADSVNEGDAVTYGFTVSDPGDDTFSLVHQSCGLGGVLSNSTFDSVSGSGSFDCTFPDGPAGSDVSVQVADSDLASSNTATLTVTIANVAPVLSYPDCSASYPGDAIEGDVVTVTASFTDAGTIDTHTAYVQWGDDSGSSGDVVEDGGSGVVTAGHIYEYGGIYTVTITLTDDDGGVATTTTTAVVSGVGLNHGALQIIGTADRDDMGVKLKKDQVEVQVDFLDKSPTKRSYAVADVESIHMVLGAGDDRAQIDKDVMLDAMIDGGDGQDEVKAGGGDTIVFGGAGNDRIDGGGGNDALYGEEGDDTLSGDDGIDLLDGGSGEDNLKGDDGNDILIAGTTSYDTFVDSLRVIMAEWSSLDRDYDARVANLRNGGGPILAGTDIRLVGSGLERTCFGDLLEDTLRGENDRDWFFAGLDDNVTDAKDDEVVDLLSLP